MGTPSETASRIWARHLPLLRTDILVTSFGINLLSLALPVVVLQVYDRIIPNAAFETLAMLMAGLAAAFLLDAILKSARAYLAGWAGAKFEHQTGMTAIEKLLKADLGKVEKTPAGEHLDRLQSVDAVRDFYASQASLAFVDLPFVVLFLGLLAFIAGPLAFIPLVLLFVFGGTAVWMGVSLHKALSDRAVWDDRRYNFIIESLSGIHTIKSMGMETLIERRYERLMESCALSGYQVAYKSGLAQSIGNSFSQITVVAVAAAGSLYVMAGDLSVGALAACTLLAGRTVQPVLRAMGLWTRYQSVKIAEERLGAFDQLTRVDTAGTRIDTLQSIELKKAGFQYAAGKDVVLKDLNFKIEAGKIIGIRGGNGVGKTTLLWLLMGGLKPTEGQIFFNKADGEQVRLDSLRGQIAFVPQQPILFQGSVLENMTMFREGEILDEALEVAARLGLDRVFARMPDGYQTQVGDMASSNVPAGIAQRIAIVRALIGSPKIILFDEANSALDSNSDKRLKQLLEDCREKAGIVLVSYRPSLLAIADQRLELKGGTLVPFNTAAGKPAKALVETV